MISPDFLNTCIALAKQSYGKGSPPSRTPTVETPALSGFTDDFPDNIAGRGPPLLQDSAFEAESYYVGLPSTPVLVYRTGTTPWEKPTGPQAYRVLKEARPVFDHRIATVCDELGPKVPDYLDSVGVAWTSVDVVSFAKAGEAHPGPVVLWIGVKPRSLSVEDARAAAVGCLGLLREFEIADVDVEFRESVFTRLAGP